MEKFKKISILVFSMILGISSLLFAFGNKEVPVIPPVTSGTQYISPNGDGIQDSAVLKFSVKVYVKSKEGYVPEYGIQILDSSDKVLKEVKETEKSDIGWFASIFQGYKEFTLDREISWDGTDLKGKQVPDGTYKVKLFVVDSSKNKNETYVDDFVVDTVKPSAVIVPPEKMIFSPNGDGNLDTFIIKHTQATEEKLWEGSILDADGNVVRSYTWKDNTPGTIEWDGKDNSGNQVSPGTYSYTLTSTDRAGNSSDSIELQGIIMDETTTTVEVVVENPYFSPNNDGIKDSTTVYMDELVKTGITSWAWNVADTGGKIYLKSSGTGDVPLSVKIDGTDNNGNPMPEGMYRFNFEVTYLNGNNPGTSETFTIDITPPDIQVNVDSSVFSPDGDGKKDVALIQLKSNEIVTWKGTILSSTGEAVLSKTSDQTTSLIVWDGTDSEGNRVQDGDYAVRASFTDRAGNTTDINPFPLIVDTAPVSVLLAAGTGFSPNNDGNDDTEKFVVDASQYDNVDIWSLEILNKEGNTIRKFSGKEYLPKTIEWNGMIKDASGNDSVAPEDSYTAVITAYFKKGVVKKQTSNHFSLDVTPPSITLEAASDPFAATDTGVEGDVYVTLQVKDNTRVKNWNMDVLSPDGEILRTYSGDGDPSGEITWKVATDKKTADIVSSEGSDIILRLTVTDEGSNRTVYEKNVSIEILLVMKNGRKYISVPNIIFGAYKYTLGSAGTKFLNRNKGSLDKVAEIYKKYPKYGLILEGHALDIYLDSPRQEKEEKILFPLTQHRAETVKNALVNRGMEAEKIKIEAYGGLHPIVSVHDKTVWWKNRRVEFVMVDPEE